MSTPDAIASWLAQRYPLQRALCLQLGRDLTEARLAGDTARPLSDAVGGQLLACGAAASDPLLAPLTFRGGRLAWSACVRDEIQIAEALRSRAAAAPLRASAGQVAIINAGRDGSQDHAVRTVAQADAIADACRQHQVLRMHLFGSALRDDFDPTRSDLDLLVEFQPIESGALVQAYFGLERQLASKQLIYEA